MQDYGTFSVVRDYADEYTGLLKSAVQFLEGRIEMDVAFKMRKCNVSKTNPLCAGQWHEYANTWAYSLKKLRSQFMYASLAHHCGLLYQVQSILSGLPQRPNEQEPRSERALGR